MKTLLKWIEEAPNMAAAVVIMIMILAAITVVEMIGTTAPAAPAEMTSAEYLEKIASAEATSGGDAQSVIQAARQQTQEYLVAAGLLHIDDNGATGTGYGSIDMPTPVPPSKTPATPRPSPTPTAPKTPAGPKVPAYSTKD